MTSGDRHAMPQGRRYFSLESMRKLTTPEEQIPITAPLHLEPIR